MANLELIALAATGCINLGLSAFIYSRDRRAPANISFGLFALFLCFWALAILGFRNAVEPGLQLWSLRFSYVSAALIAACFYLFSLLFPKRDLRPTHLARVIAVTLALCVFILLPGALVVAPMGVYPAHGAELHPLGYAVFAFAFSILFLGALVRLWRRSAAAQGAVRLQLRIVAASVSVIGTIGIYYNLVLPSPMFEDFRFVWTGPVFTAVFALIITYSVFRYRLFNARALLAEVLVFALWLALGIRTLLSETRGELLGQLAVLVISIPIGFLLLRSVTREIRALEAANARLSELDRLKSEFVSIASHQLRGPVAAIRGYVSLLLEGSYGRLTKPLREPLDRIEESARVLAGAIDDYLNVSKIEQGTMTYAFERIDLRSLVASIVDGERRAAAKAGLRLSVSAAGRGPFVAKVDAGKLTQVVNNLIDNALKYTKKGSVAVTLARDEAQKTLRISVADTGLGIDREALPRLFEKFSRAGDAHRANASGSGLGLYVARLLVEAHGGRITAASEGRGKGSVFTIELPSEA
jgi:signal transduction histidine kinase